jgi:predicted glycoside hydrolase/deacetylase ChbG (UPF0249 family)
VSKAAHRGTLTSTDTLTYLENKSQEHKRLREAPGLQKDVHVYKLGRALTDMFAHIQEGGENETSLSVMTHPSQVKVRHE